MRIDSVTQTDCPDTGQSQASAQKAEEIQRKLQEIRRERAERRRQMLSRANKKARRRKKLKYNSMEISSQLIRVARAQGAAQILVRAQSKVAMIQKCRVTGDYDEGEVRAALNHALRMVRCARMKLGNLRDEEQLQKVGKKQRRDIDGRQRIKVEAKIRQMVQLELQKRRRKHRDEEVQAIRKANMDYDRENMQNQQNQQTDCVVLELSSYARRQIRQQAEREVQRQSENQSTGGGGASGTDGIQEADVELSGGTSEAVSGAELVAGAQELNV